jgi:hypothetical protein
MKKIKYTTLFEYAIKEWRMTWNECHQIFFKTNAIDFHGLSDIFYYDDLVDEIDNEVFPPLWSEKYGRAMQIIRRFMENNGCCDVRFYGH